MLPVAAAAGAVLAAIRGCVSTAMGFEKALSGVAARSMASAEELAVLEKSALDLGASTSFTAVQVVQAQDELVKKGFKVNQIVEAMPGLLSLAAATQSDLALASNVTTAALNSFGLAAEKSGEVADIIAAASTGSATDINGLAMALQNAGGIVASVGGDFALLAAIQGKLQDKGIGDSVAATSTKIMFERLAAPTGEAANSLKALDVATQDSQKNMLPFLDIMQQLETKMAEMGTAQQADYLKKIFGAESLPAVMGLFKAGIKDVDEFAKHLRNSAGTSEEMARVQLDNLAGDLTILGSAWEGLSITIGKLFTPILRKVTQAITSVVEWFNKLVKHPLGAFFIKLVATISTIILAITALSAGIWALSKAGGALYGIFAPIKAALLGLGWPILTLIAAIGLLYAAYKNNFGGIADILNRWRRNIALVCNGVIEVFKTMTDGVGEIRGELAKDIKAAGLEGIVTTVSKVIYRIKSFFKGLWYGLNFDRATAILQPVIDEITGLFNELDNFISGFFNDIFSAEIKSASAAFTDFGRKVAAAINGIVETAANFMREALPGVKAFLAGLVEGIKRALPQIKAFLAGLWNAFNKVALGIKEFFTGLWAGLNFDRVLAVLEPIIDRVKGIFKQMREIVSGIVQKVFGGDAAEAALSFEAFGNAVGIAISWIVEAAATMAGVFVNGFGIVINLVQGLIALFTGDWQGAVSAAQNVWDSLVASFMGIADLFRIGDWLREAWDKAKAVLASIDLFECGAAILDTLINGIKSKAESLKNSVSDAFSSVRNLLPFSDAREGPFSELTLSGSRIMTTLAEGANQGADSLYKSVSGGLDAINKDLALTLPETDIESAIRKNVQTCILPLPQNNLADALKPENLMPRIGPAGGAAPADAKKDALQSKNSNTRQGNTYFTIHIGNISLPDVADARGFAEDLRDLVMEYGG